MALDYPSEPNGITGVLKGEGGGQKRRSSSEERSGKCNKADLKMVEGDKARNGASRKERSPARC